MSHKPTPAAHGLCRPDAAQQAPTAHALRESEECLNAIFDASPDAMLISDASGIIVLASRQVEALLGYSASELLGQTIDVLVPQHARHRHAGLREQYLDAPSTRRMGQRREIRALRKDGGECLVEIGLSQVLTSVGMFVATSLRDITRRKAAEDKVREHAERLHHLYEMSPLGIALTDMEGRFLEFNQAFQHICGYPENELKLLDYWALTPRSFAPDEAEQLNSLEQHGRYGPYEKDYVRKDGSVVPVRLNGVLMKARNGKRCIWSIVEDISTQKSNAAEIRQLAFFDQLTGLPNRALLQDRLRCAIVASGRTGSYGALLLIDLDNFKEINDTRGHSTGDVLLTKVADILSQNVRAEDTLSRLGGDEFVLLLSNLGPEASEAALHAKTIAEKMLVALNSRVELGAETHQCTASIGATMFSGHSLAGEEAMKQADLAMYRAKAAGRNTVRFFDPAMEAAMLARAALEADLRSALERKQFVLHYQPQVDGAGRMVGAEALLRWHHPERGIVGPADFIGLAEETGLILPLGLWVLETACVQLARWAQLPLWNT
ncbi:diguanylate cyclase [Oxalobacteraceae bacterium]|nr:diguanylate cyclase [Oxalobacteraceae bacterium]